MNTAITSSHRRRHLSALVVHTLMLALLVGSALANPQAVDRLKPIAQHQSGASQPQIQPSFDTSSLEKTIRESIKEASERPDPHANEKSEIDRKLSAYTGELSSYTLWLVVATLCLAVIAVWQGWQLKRTVDVAVAEAQPVLSPFVSDMTRLHEIIGSRESVDFNGAHEFPSRILFAFENHGKTPALIRQVRADLFVTERDRLPKVNFESLPVIFHQETVPAETKRSELLGAHAELAKTFKFTSVELAEINSEAKGQFRRFFLLGQVIYDDYFGIRHTRRFCVKLRLMPNGSFQAQHGGISYNSATRKRAPKKNDPLDGVES